MSLLELGETEVSPIAEKACLKRTTVYNILPELVNDGLVSMTTRRGKKVFAIDSLSSLSRHIEDKKDSIEQILPELSSMQSLFFKKPKTVIYEGLKGLKAVYRDFLLSSAPGDVVLSYSGSNNIFKYIPEEFLREYAKKRVDKKIRLRLISGNFDLSKELKAADPDSLRETRITGVDEFDFSGETIIYGQKVAFISYQENFLCVVIESKEISAMQRSAFNLLWDRLS